MEFEDVVKARTIEEFNIKTRQYLEERNLFGEEKRKHYWALFYAWKERKA